MLPTLLRKSYQAFAGIVLGRNVRTTEDHNYRNLVISSIWGGFLDGGISTYLSVFLARIGASASTIGLMTSGPALLGVLLYLPGGAYAERQQNLVRLTVWSASVSRLAFLLLALAPFFIGQTTIPFVAVALWTLTAIPNALYIPAWTTVVQQAISPRKRAQFNGTRWSLLSVVSSICIVLFGFMLDRIAIPTGYQVVFFISWAASMISLISFSRVKIPPFTSPKRDTLAGASLAQRATTFLRLFTESKPFVRYNLATLAFRIAITMPAALYSLYWVDVLNASNTWIGLRGTAGYMTLVLGYAFWGRIANRLGHRRLLMVGGAMFGLYPIFTALTPSPQWLIPVAVLWGLSISSVDIGLFDMLLEVCPEGRQPTFVAIANLIASLASFIGPLLGAVLVQVFELRVALLVIGAIQVASILFFVFLPHDEHKSDMPNRELGM
ncbi:MAG: MFS transporter [Chloroflexi bacterium]|nr:MFS transporter [Chloroflexota bacterium]